MNDLGGSRFDCLTEDVYLVRSPIELGDKIVFIVVAEVNYKIRDS